MTRCCALAAVRRYLSVDCLAVLYYNTSCKRHYAAVFVQQFETALFKASGVTAECFGRFCLVRRKGTKSVFCQGTSTPNPPFADKGAKNYRHKHVFIRSRSEIGYRNRLLSDRLWVRFPPGTPNGQLRLLVAMERGCRCALFPLLPLNLLPFALAPPRQRNT